MAGNFKNRKFFLAYSDVFKRQSAWDVAVANSDINKRHPQLTPTVPGSQFTREKTPDCSGEYFIAEDLTSRLKRVRFGFNPNAQMLAGWLALAMGSAAAPTGTPADETQTLTITAGDPYSLSFTHEGLTGTTALIPIDAAASVIAAELNALRSIKQGAQKAANVAVSGDAGGPYTIAFQNKLAKTNVALLVSSEATAVVTTGTAGANKLHAISRSTADQPPQTSLIYGFDGDSDHPLKVNNAVVNEITVSGQAKGRVLVELDLVATWPFDAGVYSMPDCINFSPITTKDVRLAINDVFYVDDLRNFSYTYSNNIITDDDPFPWDDIDAIRLEKGDRTSSFSFTLFGSHGDGLYTLAESEPEEDIELHIGPGGDRVSIFAPSAKLRLQDQDTTFIGSANRSAINIDAEPFLNEDLVGTPDYAEANIDQTVAYLGT